jgi:hypothetical protein
VFLVLMLGACFSPKLSAGESIWSGLVLATNEEHPAETAPELKKYTAQLKDIFGYNHYELIGHHVELMDNDNEHWLVPGKDFALLVESKKATKPGYHYRLKLDLYQEKKLLATMDSRLCGQNLLFIRGPYYGKGELVIILVVK